MRIQDPSPQTLLIRAPNWIGDQIIAYPFYASLRKAYPHAKITVACVPWVKDLQFQDLVDEVVVIPRTRKALGRFIEIDEVASSLWAERSFDLGFSLPHSFSAAWFLNRAGAKERRGFAGEGRGWLLTQPLAFDPDPKRHRAQAYVDLLPDTLRPHYSIRDFWKENPHLHFDPLRSWKPQDTLEPPSEPYFVVAPGSRARSRAWSVESYIQLMELICADLKIKGVLIGSPSEKEVGDRILTEADADLISLMGKSSVAGLWKVFRQAQFTICNESGLAHLASLCGSPVQIVCGAADPSRTQPIGPGPVQVATHPIDCWPCEKNVCRNPPESENACLKGITPDRIWKEVKRAYSPTV